MQYTYLQDYIITQEKIDKAIKEKSIRKFRHMFYPLSATDIHEAVQSFDPFPVELKTFYEEIGFGNFHCNKEYVNCLLDPHSLVHINQRKYRYNYDKIPSAPEPSVSNTSPHIATGNNKIPTGSWLLEDDDNFIIS